MISENIMLATCSGIFPPQLSRVFKTHTLYCIASREYRSTSDSTMPPVLSICGLIVIGLVTANVYGFDCYNDPCVRGQHFCSEVVMRCVSCHDRQDECGTPQIPQECDSYCLEIQVKELQESVQTLQVENEALNASVNNISDTFQKEEKRLKEENDNLQRELSQERENVTSMTRKLNIRKLENTNLGHQLTECKVRSDDLQTAIIVVGGLLVVVVVAVVAYAVRRHLQERSLKKDISSNDSEKGRLLQTPSAPSLEESGDGTSLDSGNSSRDSAEFPEGPEKQPKGPIVCSDMDNKEQANDHSVRHQFITPNNINDTANGESQMAYG